MDPPKLSVYRLSLLTACPVHFLHFFNLSRDERYWYFDIMIIVKQNIMIIRVIVLSLFTLVHKWMYWIRMNLWNFQPLNDKCNI